MDHRIAADLYMVEGFQGLSMLWSAKCFYFAPSNFEANQALQPLASVSTDESAWAIFCLIAGIVQVLGVVLMVFKGTYSTAIPVRLVSLAVSSSFFFSIGCGYVFYTPDRILGVTAVFLGLRGWWSLFRIAMTAGDGTATSA